MVIEYPANQSTEKERENQKIKNVVIRERERENQKIKHVVIRENQKIKDVVIRENQKIKDVVISDKWLLIESCICICMLVN